MSQEEKEMDSKLGCLYSTLGFVLLPVVILTHGLALMWAWNWLAAPTFSLPELTYLQAVIINFLCIFVRGAKGSGNPMKTDDDLMKAFQTMLMATFGKPIVIIVFALILKLFV